MRSHRLAASFLAAAVALAVSRPAQAGDGGVLCVASPEVCDCKDNDCDGKIDNPQNGASLCYGDEVCVKGEAGCECARRASRECPPHTVPDHVTDSATGQDLGWYCVRAPCPTYCDLETLKDAKGNVLCARVDTVDGGCVTPPPCVCKDHHCAVPCEDTTCPDGKVCADRGPAAGSCVEDTCDNVPCRDCDARCVKGVCVANPCVPGACKADEVCRATPDYGGVECTLSCADVCCNVGERCVTGKCIPTCTWPCEGSSVCDDTRSPPVCGESICDQGFCPPNSPCNPITHLCDGPPCKGVLCPEGQECYVGECRSVKGAGGGGGRSQTCTGSGGNGGSAAGGDAGGNGAADATAGGSGCRCEVGAGASRAPGPRWALMAVLAAVLLRARRRRGGSRAGEVDVPLVGVCSRRLAASFLAAAVALAASRTAQAGDGGPPRWCVPSPEVCDCRDNDCDGQVDNAPAGGSLCDNNNVCVKSAAGCLCTYRCYLHGDDTPCLGGSGLTCEPVTDSATGKELGQDCVPYHDVPNPCSADCKLETRKDAKGNVLCAPAGTVLEGCVTPALCVCKGHECAGPCEGTICPDGKVCIDRGWEAGACLEDSCDNVPCRGCDVRCVHGVCVANPCVPGACKADEMCKPAPDYGHAVCTPSCANICCNVGERCVAQVCIPSCEPPCEGSAVCDEAMIHPGCVKGPCTECADQSCKGVLCPEGQECYVGECRFVKGGFGAGGRSHRCTGSGGNGGSAAGDDGTAGAAAGRACRCEVGAGASRAPGPPWTLMAVLAAVLLRARRRRGGTHGRGLAAHGARPHRRAREASRHRFGNAARAPICNKEARRARRCLF